jgi:hypothetical protein
MQRAGEPQTEGRENLADVLGHRCDNPGSGQQAIDQERPKHHVAKRARDEGRLASSRETGAVGAITFPGGPAGTIASPGSVGKDGCLMAISRWSTTGN